MAPLELDFARRRAARAGVVREPPATADSPWRKPVGGPRSVPRALVQRRPGHAAVLLGGPGVVLRHPRAVPPERSRAAPAPGGARVHDPGCGLRDGLDAR